MTPKKSFAQWLGSHIGDFEAVLLDIDGVLLNDTRRLPGSKTLLELLECHDKPFVLLTNDGNHSPREKAHRLNSAGLAITPQQIISCGHALEPAIASLSLAEERFFIMGDTGAPCYAQAAGVKVTREIDQLTECKGVIIGEENYAWEPVINAVVNYFIDHPTAPLIVPNPDDFYPGPVSHIHIAAGGIARFIQSVLKAYGMDIHPIYLGKPFAPIFELAQSAIDRQTGRNLAAQRILMVGDNMAADIAGGTSRGFTTALMLTGVTTVGTLAQFPVMPDLVFEVL